MPPPTQTQSNMVLHNGRKIENLIQNTVKLASSVTLKKKKWLVNNKTFLYSKFFITSFILINNH